MVTIETPTAVIKINQSKVRKNRDEWHDFVLPPELETREEQEAVPPTIGPFQEEPGTPVPVADPDISDSGVATQTRDQLLAYENASSPDADYSGTDLYSYSFFCVDPAPALWQVANTKDVDLLEIFPGSERISQAIAEQGMQVYTPENIRSDHDITTVKGRKATWDLITASNPKTVWMSLKRFASSLAANESSTAARFCAEVAEYQMHHGRYFVLEDPYSSRMRHARYLKDLPGVHCRDVDLCRYGLKDPTSHIPIKECLTILHNFPSSSLEPLF